MAVNKQDLYAITSKDGNIWLADSDENEADGRREEVLGGEEDPYHIEKITVGRKCPIEIVKALRVNCEDAISELDKHEDYEIYDQEMAILDTYTLILQKLESAGY